MSIGSRGLRLAWERGELGSLLVGNPGYSTVVNCGKEEKIRWWASLSTMTKDQVRGRADTVRNPARGLYTAIVDRRGTARGLFAFDASSLSRAGAMGWGIHYSH